MCLKITDIPISTKLHFRKMCFTTKLVLDMKRKEGSWCIEPRCEKNGLRGFRPGPTQTGLYNNRRWLEVWIFGFRKWRYCTIYVAKPNALISFAVTAKLICVFVFAYAKSRLSHDEVQIKVHGRVFLNGTASQFVLPLDRHYSMHLAESFQSLRSQVGYQTILIKLGRPAIT